MRLIFLICIFSILGCSSESTVESFKESNIQEIDSLLAHSEQIIVESHTVNQKADSVVKQDVVKVLNELESAKQEARSLRMMQKVEIVRVDTVYIETKKNFWGKEKTKTRVISDSIVTVDSLEN